METSLHRQLKEHYSGKDSQVEVPLGKYRIDVVRGEQLIEIQHGGLAAIRDKIQELVAEYSVLVVKPIVCRKTIIRLTKKDGDVVSRRLSPKKGTIFNLFDELVYFTRAFPHPNLTLEVPLVQVEEWRYPGHGRRRRRRKADFQIEDQKLVSVDETYQFQRPADLVNLIAYEKLPSPFHTGHLADIMQCERWIAQRVAYCFREIGATKQVGKQGNALLYSFKKAPKATSRCVNSRPTTPTRCSTSCLAPRTAGGWVRRCRRGTDRLVLALGQHIDWHPNRLPHQHRQRLVLA